MMAKVHLYDIRPPLLFPPQKLAADPGPAPAAFSMDMAPSAPLAPMVLPKSEIDVAAAAAALAAKLADSVPTAPDPLTKAQQDEELRLRKIYVGNLPRELNDETVRAIFEPFGPVDLVNLVKSKETGLSLG